MILKIKDALIESAKAVRHSHRRRLDNRNWCTVFRQGFSWQASFFNDLMLKIKNALIESAKAVRHSRRRRLDNRSLYAMFYVYLLRSTKFPDQKYVGHTDNLRERLETHNSGGSIHTKTYRPWKLVMFLGFNTQAEALKFEKYLKSGAGRAFANKRFWS